MEIFWDRIQGLKENLGFNGVCSNYAFDTVESTWKEIHNFKGGRAIFTFPNTPIKCGGAPQKIMYLAEDFFRKMQIRNQCEILFASAGAQIFSVKKYAEKLSAILQKRDIHTLFNNNLVAIDGLKREAYFKNLETQQESVIRYDMIHVTPSMGSPVFIRKSPLADKDGWISVDKFTLQHTKYPNIFGLGDASSLPTSRTGAAIRKQAPTLVKNLVSFSRGLPLSAKDDGYTSLLGVFLLLARKIHRVMVGAILVYSIAYWLILKRQKPLIEEKLQISEPKKVNGLLGSLNYFATGNSYDQNPTFLRC